MNVVKKGSIIQVGMSGPVDWIGCLMQVDEVKSFGVQAFVKIPMQGNAYLRLNTGQFEYIAEAALTAKD